MFKSPMDMKFICSVQYLQMAPGNTDNSKITYVKTNKSFLKLSNSTKNLLTKLNSLEEFIGTGQKNVCST